MTTSQIVYITFGVVLSLAIIFDLGLFSKKGTVFSIKKALSQTIFWVLLALAFFGFLWYEDGRRTALEYLSAYLMEWSLSIDNIFVFILIFSFFGVKEKYYARVLLFGILLAIVLRILFITVGIALVNEFHWILYVFGAILIYTGVNMFFAKKEEDANLDENRVYRWLKRVLPLTSDDGGGRLTLVRDGEKFYTSIFVVIVLLATTDIVFAVDSIPAVFGITQNKLVIYTSNIFAVLGLRSLFFLLQGAIDKFEYLPKGIAVVLVFVGLKMLSEILGVHVPIMISLLVILVCILVSIFYSVLMQKKEDNSS
ncbi:MAG TPA: TerC/Alx family metal homeostasis membrane protein [Puia sp.]|nr:TerC/Alx family metal homeostasis membrane protein [Puia sp.]